MNADIHVLTGAYACDALDLSELGAFEEHLASCDSCAQEVTELRATAAALALAEAVEPPAGLRERVMAEVAITRQLAPVVSPLPPTEDEPSGRSDGPDRSGTSNSARSPEAGRSGPGASGSAEGGTTGISRRSVSRRRPPGDRPAGRRWTRSAAWVSAAALLVGLVALGGLVRHQQSEIDALRGQTSAVTTLLAAPDAKAVAGAVKIGGTVTVISSGSDNGMVFSATGLPPLPAGKAYQLWMINGSGVRPGPVLEPVDGRIPAVFAGNLDGAQTIAMTVEPSSGSTHPTTTPVLLLTLAA